MNIRKRFWDRWKADYDFRTIITAAGSFAVTVAFALYNGYLGIDHHSLWHGTICVYYIILAMLRGLIIAAEHRLSALQNPEKKRNRAYLASSVLLLLLNISLIVPIAIMVKQQKPVSMTLIPAIAMAAYSTYKITVSSINLKRRNRSANGLIRLLRTIHFIDALVSILTLQNTLIMVSSASVERSMLPFTAISSGAVWAAVLCLSISAMIRGIVGIRNKS